METSSQPEISIVEDFDQDHGSSSVASAKVLKQRSNNNTTTGAAGIQTNSTDNNMEAKQVQNSKNPMMCNDMVLRHVFSMLSFQDLKNLNLVSKQWRGLCNIELRKRSIRYFELEPDTNHVKQQGNPHGLVKSRELLAVMKESQLMPVVSFQFKMKGFCRGAEIFFKQLIKMCGKHMQRLEIHLGNVTAIQLQAFRGFITGITKRQAKDSQSKGIAHAERIWDSYSPTIGF